MPSARSSETMIDRDAIRARFVTLERHPFDRLTAQTWNQMVGAIADLAVDVAELEARLAIERSKWCHYCGAPWDWSRPTCRWCGTSRPPEGRT
jgi:hypothetical protein